MATPTYTASGTKSTTAAKLDKSVFDVEVQNHELIKQAYVSHMANGRNNSAVVKTRGLVRGGGKKPWKQKGTGRARFGSSRNPIWRGGGIVFGPTGKENYTKSLNGKAGKLATKQALTLAAAANKIIVIDDLKSDGKTGSLATYLQKIQANGTVLLVVETVSEELTRASANLSSVKVCQPGYVNVFNVLNADQVVMTKSSVEQVTQRLGGDK